MEENKPIKITIERNDSEKLELTTPWDSSLEDYEHNFRIILAWLTFGNDTIDEFFNRNEFGEEIEDKEIK